MDSIILPGGNQVPGGQPVMAMPVIPQKIKDAQKHYIESGKAILDNIQERMDNTEDFDNIVILSALKWLIKGQLPIDL